MAVARPLARGNQTPAASELKLVAIVVGAGTNTSVRWDWGWGCISNSKLEVKWAKVFGLFHKDVSPAPCNALLNALKPFTHGYFIFYEWNKNIQH